MTSEEAITILKANVMVACDTSDKVGYGTPLNKAIEQALNMAIKSLDKPSANDVLDKIRVEIKAMFPPRGKWEYDEAYGEEQTVCEVLSGVLKIIDEYKSESEVSK